MPNNIIFIERRDGGDFAARKANSQRASYVSKTQKDAIEKAKSIDPNTIIHVERVRNTTNGSRDKWRKI